MLLISLQKLFSLWRKSNFRILEIQVPCHHQMPYHKTRNTFFLNKLGSKHSLLMKFGQFRSYYKRNNSSKNSKKIVTWKTSSRPFYVCKELITNSFGKQNFWNKLNYQNLPKLAHRHPQITFCSGFFEN